MFVDDCVEDSLLSLDGIFFDRGKAGESGTNKEEGETVRGENRILVTRLKRKAFNHKTQLIIVTLKPVWCFW